VVLEVETTVSEPNVHLAGDNKLENAILSGTIITLGKMPIAGAMITAFNTEKTRSITVYSHPDGSYSLPISFTGKHGPHSIAEGSDGRLWITNSLSSRLMAYTAETNTFETFDIAADTLYLHTIRTDPKGRLWFTVVASNQVGRFDPETLELVEFDTPAIGPRRPRFAPNGILWIPGFDSGELVSFDPKTEKFTSYPLPTRVSFLRDMVFTEDGKVCSSNSNLPAYAIEGGLGGFICLNSNTEQP